MKNIIFFIFYSFECRFLEKSFLYIYWNFQLDMMNMLMMDMGIILL